MINIKILHAKVNFYFLYSDEISAFDALQTLADLSLMMPATENENGKDEHCRPFSFCVLQAHFQSVT